MIMGDEEYEYKFLQQVLRHSGARQAQRPVHPNGNEPNCLLDFPLSSAPATTSMMEIWSSLLPETRRFPDVSNWCWGRAVRPTTYINSSTIRRSSLPTSIPSLTASRFAPPDNFQLFRSFFSRSVDRSRLYAPAGKAAAGGASSCICPAPHQ